MEPSPNQLATFINTQYLLAQDLKNVESGEKFKNFIANYPKLDIVGTTTLTGGIERIYRFMELKFRYPINPDGYSCLKISISFNGISSNYAFLYWPRGSENIVPEYICLSPTYESKDGGYRQRLTQGNVFQDAYDNYIDVLAPYEDIVMKMLNTHGLLLEHTIYSSDDEDHINRIIQTTRLLIMTFTVALFLDIPDMIHGRLMLHTNANYIIILEQILKLYPFLYVIKDKNTKIKNHFHNGTGKKHTTKCGQKIVPLIIKETMQVYDYNYPAWKELLLTTYVSDLVINFISPSFALYNNWTYIVNTDRNIFENESMGIKYKRSEIADKIVRYLRDSRNMLLTEDIKNSRTQAIYSKLLADIEYSRSFLTISSISMMYTMEDVGCTVHSYLPLLQSYPSNIRDVFVSQLATRDNVAKTIFELAYAAHCLHVKMGLIHTDLHSNNMTIFEWGVTTHYKRTPPDNKVTLTQIYQDPVIAYVAGERGEADTYIFPSSGVYACIIDYSRSILGPAFRERLQENKPERYADNFYKDQVTKVMKTFHRYIPTLFEKYRTIIKEAITNNFDVIFSILSCVDYIGIGTAIANRYEKLLAAPIPEIAINRNIVVSPDIVTIARKLETVGRETLITMIQEFVSAALLGGEIKVPPFPGYKIISRVFGEWSFPKWAAREPQRVKTAQLVDSYNINNPIKYSGASYDKFPLWARLDELDKHLGDRKITDYFPHGIEEFLKYLRMSSYVETISENVKAEQDILDGPIIEATSSWAE